MVIIFSLETISVKYSYSSNITYKLFVIIFTSTNYCYFTTLFSISQICVGPDAGNLETKNATTKPIQIFKFPESSPIYSLATYKNILFIGTVACIHAYAWNKNEISKKLWEVKLSSTSNSEPLELGEVNCLWLDKANGYLFAGCGDNTIYVVNIDKAQLIRDFIGHKDYIHSVHGSENRIFSASEDGTVKFWDVREKKCSGQLEPYKTESLQRPKFGKWQGTVSVTDDWLICGGGPKFSLWHLRSLECTTIYPFPSTAHVSGFLDDILFVAGDYSYLNQYSLNGDVTAEVPVSAASVYSVVYQMEPKIMSIGGSSNSLDICTDFNYKDIVINLYR